MALHQDLPIYRIGTDLLAMGYLVQRDMPRGFKRTLGERIVQGCLDMLGLMALANTIRAERADNIRKLLAIIHATTANLQVAYNLKAVSVEVRGDEERLALVPAHKSLFNAPAGYGLPIGNLSSQFFANVLLDQLDQHIKHKVGARHYVRYVDDFVLVHESARWLNDALASIITKLDSLHLALNPSKTILQPVARGVDFVGHVLKPWSRTTRKRTVRHALVRIWTVPASDLFTTGNSYFGLLRQSPQSHTDRARLANALRRRGHSVKSDLTKTYRTQT